MWAELRAAPGLGELLGQPIGEALDRHPNLLEGVAVTKRDGVVLAGLAVDRDPPRRADLVLATVAAADRAALVVLGGHSGPHGLVDLPRPLGHSLLGDKR